MARRLIGERWLFGFSTTGDSPAVAVAVSAHALDLRVVDGRIVAPLNTGAEVWRTDLPASGHGTPVSYRGPRSGRQFVVIAAGGGGRFSRTISDAIVAFVLPRP